MLTWVTSTALVALLAAVILFPWHRSVEESFALKREKRELYRRFLRAVDDTTRAKQLVSTELDRHQEINGLISEIFLICELDTGEKLNSFSLELSERSSSFIGRDIATIDLTDQERESLQWFGSELVAITFLLKRDIQETTVPAIFPSFRKK